MLTIAPAADLLPIFVSLELVSVRVVLAGFKVDVKSNEAALKFFSSASSPPP